MNFQSFRRRASTASVEDELDHDSDTHHSGGAGSSSMIGGGGGGSGSSTGLSAVSPRRAAARALASSLSADGGGGAEARSDDGNPFARAAAAVAAPFRRVARENSAGRTAAAPPPPPLRRGGSGLALLAGSDAPAAAPFEVEGGPGEAASAPAPASAAAAAARSYEAAVMKRVDRAILPCFMVLTLVNYLDRTNLSYASIQMSADIGLTPQQYGVGSSLFFVGYVGMQLPLVFAATRVGRLPFLAASCVLWGVCAAAFAGVKGVAGFYVLRILLGVSEAATFPIMWAHVRAFYGGSDVALGHAYAHITAVIAAAQIVGGPLAALLLRLDGLLGLAGWQVLFLFEAVPTLGVAGWVLALPRSPETAGCLDPEARRWLGARVRNAGAGGAAAAGSPPPPSGGSRERQRHQLEKKKSTCSSPPSSSSSPSTSSVSVGATAARSSLTSWRIWTIGGIEALVSAAKYGVIYWTPLLVAAMFTKGGDEFSSSSPKADSSSSSFHHAPPPPASAAAAVAALSAVPFGLAAIATLANSAHSKRTGERRWHVVWPVAACAVGLAGLGLALNSERKSASEIASSVAAASDSSSSAAARAAAPAFASLVVASLVFASTGVVASYPSSIIKKAAAAAAAARAAAAAAAATAAGGTTAAAGSASLSSSSSRAADDAAAALGYGLANALGNLGGLVGPAAFGAARTATGGYAAACALLSVFAAVAAVLYAVVLPLVAPDNEDGGGDKKGGKGGGGGFSSSRSPPSLETKTSAAAS